MKINRSYFSVNTGLAGNLAPSDNVLFNIFFYLLCLLIFPLFSITSFILFTFNYFKCYIFNLDNYT